ncbi:MAG TPA: hypothetical protein VNK91_11670, partial [Burkholderiaceae bacterium]|nr:hypothetical protein [Burkholderiaceae bacterium]
MIRASAGLRDARKEFGRHIGADVARGAIEGREQPSALWRGAPRAGRKRGLAVCPHRSGAPLRPGRMAGEGAEELAATDRGRIEFGAGRRRQRSRKFRRQSFGTQLGQCRQPVAALETRQPESRRIDCVLCRVP